jgi:hypothetical protein
MQISSFFIQSSRYLKQIKVTRTHKCIFNLKSSKNLLGIVEHVLYLYLCKLCNISLNDLYFFCKISGWRKNHG